MGIEIKYGTGQTPIEEEEKEELIPPWIFNTHQLNLAEQENISKASLFFARRNIAWEEILSFQFMKRLHKKMFCDVWKWAGEIRRTDKNIGVCKTHIISYTYETLDDAKYWIKNRIYEKDEIAIRCKHRIVAIHLFPNGNGRHSRLLADILIKSLGRVAFSWGTELNTPRKTYLESLRKADRGDYQPLIEFSRS